jgi:hypothetical protein
MIQRHDEQSPGGTDLDVGDNAKVATDERTFTFGEVAERQVVGNPIFEPRVVELEVPSAGGQREMKQCAPSGSGTDRPTKRPRKSGSLFPPLH